MPDPASRLWVALTAIAQQAYIWPLASDECRGGGADLRRDDHFHELALDESPLGRWLRPVSR